MKSWLAEVQTGFEPLFFHIQADFQWQRPFSEGCGGEIPEKLKKNLSQSYGRWIVGFYEPMTSAFFALKKGAATENPLEYGKAEVQTLFEPLQAAISSMELPKNFENKKLPNPLR